MDLKILAGFPVQYQAPLYKELTEAGINIEVGYCHPGSTHNKVYDPGFNQMIAWDIDLLNGYTHRFFNLTFNQLGLKDQLMLLPKVVPWALRNPKVPLLIIGWFSELTWLVWLIRILLGMPVLITGDNTLLYADLSQRPTWRERLLKWLLLHTNAVLYYGILNKQFWLSKGVKKQQLFYTPHSIDNRRFQIQFSRLIPKRADICKQYGLDPKLPTFLYCGKLIEIKRPLELLEAFLEADLMHKAQLIYVGDGILRAKLEKRIIADNIIHVSCIGFINQSLMPLAYVLGELLCVVSQSETWGLCVNEALACGRPVLATDRVGSVPDLVHSDNGWVVPFANPKLLARALNQAYHNYNNWPVMGEQGQKLVEGYTYSKMVFGIKQALNSL